MRSLVLAAGATPSPECEDSLGNRSPKCSPLWTGMSTETTKNACRLHSSAGLVQSERLGIHFATLLPDSFLQKARHLGSDVGIRARVWKRNRTFMDLPAAAKDVAFCACSTCTKDPNDTEAGASSLCAQHGPETALCFRLQTPLLKPIPA